MFDSGSERSHGSPMQQRPQWHNRTVVGRLAVAIPLLLGVALLGFVVTRAILGNSRKNISAQRVAPTAIARADVSTPVPAISAISPSGGMAAARDAVLASNPPVETERAVARQEQPPDRERLAEKEPGRGHEENKRSRKEEHARSKREKKHGHKQGKHGGKHHR